MKNYCSNCRQETEQVSIGRKHYVQCIRCSCHVREPSDPVSHPSHYIRNGVEVLDVIEAFELGFNLGNVVKYVCRADFKSNALEDLKKARVYLEREIAKRSK